jgi:hypothetical protein
MRFAAASGVASALCTVAFDLTGRGAPGRGLLKVTRKHQVIYIEEPCSEPEIKQQTERMNEAGTKLASPTKLRKLLMCLM